MFNRISAVVLFVQDFDRSLRFYRDTLGLPVAQLEPNFVAFKMVDQDFALQEITAAAQTLNVDIKAIASQGGRVDRALLCARLDNVDTAYEVLRAKGVEFTQPPIDQAWGLRAAYFRDPEGNIWEIAHQLVAQPKG